MTNLIRTRIRWQIDSFKKSFLQCQKLPLNDFFPAETIEAIIAHTPQKRTSVFSPLITLQAFIFQVLSDDSSCQQAVAGVLVDRLSQGQSANTINTGPYCKARQRLPLAQMAQAVATTGSRLHQQSIKAWLWHGLNVVLVDAATVLMPDTPKNQAVFPQQSNQKPGLGFPIVRLLALISLATGAIIDYRLGAYQGKGTGETSLFSAGSRYFCESFYGHPCPTSGKNHATANACGCPSRPASFAGHPTRGAQHHSRNDSTRFRKACIFTTQKDAS